MPENTAHAFTVATDQVVAALIRSARTRLVVVAPAVEGTVADAICERINAMPQGDIALVFDSSEEVFRLGYGSLAALEQVKTCANECAIVVRRQLGVRIGVIVADSQTLIFSPTPALIGAGPDTQGAANAIQLGTPPRTVIDDLDVERPDGPSLGRTVLSAADMRTTKDGLERNPPQAFDVTEKVHVFSAFIEFVDIEVRGTVLSRRTISIPPFLLAVAEKNVRDQLRTTIRLVPQDDALSGASIDNDRRLLTEQYLKTIPHYGTVVLKKDKPALTEALEKLRGLINEFSERVKTEIQQRIDTTIAELTTSLLPSLEARPPDEWKLSSGERPTKDVIHRRLERELRMAFGSASGAAQGMHLHYAFKGVTYELLTNEKFLAAAAKAVPEMQQFHDEFLAARATSDQPTSQSA